MSKRSVISTDPRKMKQIEQQNPENHQVQSVQSNAYNKSTLTEDAIKHRK